MPGGKKTTRPPAARSPSKNQPAKKPAPSSPTPTPKKPRRAARPGDDWVVLVGKFRDRGPAPHGAPSDLWAAAVYVAGDPRARTVAHAMDVRRDKAVRRAITDALAAARPARVFAEAPLLATGLLGRLGLHAEPTSARHEALVTGFQGLLAEYAALAAEEDGELDDVAATAEFLDAAALALSALEIDRDAAPIAEVHPPRGGTRVALVRACAEPTVITVAPDDAEPLMRELAAGEMPSVPTAGVAFVPEDNVDPEFVTAVRDAGWTADLVPVIRVTGDGTGPIEAAPAAMRDLADVLRTLVAAGVARAGRRELATGTVEVEWPGGGHATVSWHVEDAGDDEARLH